MSSFLSGLEASGWLKHIKCILETAWWMATAVDGGASVLVHCSDGWDRTAQVCSLAAIFLDPHARTINGLQAAIEKDWLAFGHKFSERCGHVAGDPRERSPVFTQFLDCVWQLLRQKPAAFQFNERFLLTLHEHAHACQYATFVGNSEKERRDLRLSERTYSLWGYMASRLHEYRNPLYDPKAYPDLLTPDLSSQSIRFWRGMFCRYEDGVQPRESPADMLLASAERSSALTHHINYLTERISYLKSVLSRKQDSKRDTNAVYLNGASSTAPIDSELDHLTIDNKSIKLSATADHPLKESALADPVLSTSQDIKEDAVEGSRLRAALESVALDWATLKDVKFCACSTPFHHFNTKQHCWGCGRVCCTRCVSRRSPLAALASPRAAPLCAACRHQHTERAE